jgi:hypothetical protein
MKMPRYAVEIHIEVEATNEQEAFDKVRKDYTIFHDPAGDFPSEGFFIEDCEEMPEGLSVLDY